MAFIQLMVLFVLGTIPILFAAVQPWVWSVYSFCMIVAFLAYIWQNRDQLSSVPGVRMNLTVLLFLVVTLFHCLPLPTHLLSYLSPVRYQTLTSAQGLLNSPPSWQTLSYIPQLALSWWVFLISLCLFFVTVRRLCADRGILKRIVLVMTVVALVEAVYGLFQALVPTMGVLWVHYIQDYMGSARGTFINRNHFAGFIEMVWPLTLGFTLAQGGWGQRYTLKRILASERLNRQALLSLGVVVLLLSLLFSKSRAGILSASLCFLIFILLTHSGSKGLHRYTWLLLVGIIGIVVTYSLTIGVGPIANRFFTLRGGDSRLEFWRDSLPIIKDHPFGIGLRNYENVIPVYNVSMMADKRLEFAHNDYLQLLIEAGWIGFIAVLAGFFIFMWKHASRIRRLDLHNDPLRFFLAVGAFSGLISLAFHSFFDFNLQIPANCVYFATLMAILDSCTRGSRDNGDVAGKIRGLHR